MQIERNSVKKAPDDKLIKLLEEEPVVSEWQTLPQIGESCVIYESYPQHSEHVHFSEHYEHYPELM